METCRNPDAPKTKHACIVEVDESTRTRLEGSPHKNHEDNIAGNGMNSLSHCKLAHKFIPMPQALEVPDAKAAVEKEWEQLEKIPAWQLTKVRNKNEVIAEARNEGRKVHFASLMDICHLKSSESTFQKYKGRVALRGDIEKMSNGYHIKTTRMRMSSSRRSFCSHPGQNGRCTIVIEISKSECPDIWIRLPRHNWPKSWSSMEDPVVPLERNLCGHLLAGLLWERQFEKILLKYGWEKVSNSECLFVDREKGLFLSVYVHDIKLAGRKRTSKDIVDNDRYMFETRISAGAKKNYFVQGNLAQTSSHVL